jgi:hypothetical protein
MVGDVRGGDSFAGGSTFSVLSQPQNGTLAFGSAGTYTYTPGPGFVGTEAFVYQITDPAGHTSTAVEVIRVAPPVLVAVSDAYSTLVNTVVTGDASANDTHPAGSAYIAITAPMHGTLAMNGDGRYVYTPAAGYIGTDMFAYAVTDPLGQTRFATDTITVTPPAGPVAVDDTYATTYGAPVAGSAANGDNYAPGAVFTVTTLPTHGTLVFNADGTYTYTPSAGFAGTETFQYTVTDAYGHAATATDTITVAAPVLAAVNDAYSGVYGVPVAGNAAAGDIFAAGSTFAVAATPAHGSVVMNSNGAYTYTPAAGFAGVDTFTYQITDPAGKSVTATDTVTITPPALAAVGDSYTTAYNTTVNGNAALGDTYAPGSKFAVAAPPASGAVLMNADGRYAYTPPAGFAGTVSFSYEVTDPTGQQWTAVETIVVSPPKLVAVNDTVSTPFNTAVTGNAADGDSYTPGSTFAVTGTPSHGSVSMNADGTYRYLPFADYTGTDVFSYAITDPMGRVVTATETIVIAGRPAVHRCLTTFGSLNLR